jgi:hypothetical protein
MLPARISIADRIDHWIRRHVIQYYCGSPPLGKRPIPLTTGALPSQQLVSALRTSTTPSRRPCLRISLHSLSKLQTQK